MKALPKTPLDGLEVNLVMLRELDKAILGNAQLFNNKNSFFNLAIVFNALTGTVAAMVFALHI